MALVALDPGHGKNTAGKRSPVNLGLPLLREYEFNRNVSWAVKDALDRCGVECMRTVMDDSDPALHNRAELARSSGCKLFVSIHANAGGGTGIETFYREYSVAGHRLARLVCTETVKTTKMRYRGLKTKITYQGKKVDPGVLVNAENRGMAACLIECGFMDNAADLAKLRTHEYKVQCAEGITRGICLYLGVEYVKP